MGRKMKPRVLPEPEPTKEPAVLFYDTADYHGPQYNVEAPWPNVEPTPDDAEAQEEPAHG